MAVTFTVDVKPLAQRLRTIDERVRLAAFVSVAEGARAHEKDLERLTASAGLGRLARAWTNTVYGTKNSSSPAALVFPKGTDRTRGAIRAFTEGAVISGKRGQLLAIPLPAAGRVRANTPAEYTQKTGLTLSPIVRPGKPTLLVTLDARLNRRGVAVRRRRGRRQGPVLPGTSFTPIFVLLPRVAVAKRFDMRAVRNLARVQLRARFLGRVKTIMQEGNGR